MNMNRIRALYFGLFDVDEDVLEIMDAMYSEISRLQCCVDRLEADNAVGSKWFNSFGRVETFLIGIAGRNYVVSSQLPCENMIETIKFIIGKHGNGTVQ